MLTSLSPSIQWYLRPEVAMVSYVFIIFYARRSYFSEVKGLMIFCKYQFSRRSGISYLQDPKIKLQRQQKKTVCGPLLLDAAGWATTDFNLILVVRSDNIFENTSYKTFGRIVRYIYYTKYTDLVQLVIIKLIDVCMYRHILSILLNNYF